MLLNQRMWILIPLRLFLPQGCSGLTCQSCSESLESWPNPLPTPTNPLCVEPDPMQGTGVTDSCVPDAVCVKTLSNGSVYAENNNGAKRLIQVVYNIQRQCYTFTEFCPKPCFFSSGPTTYTRLAEGPGKSYEIFSVITCLCNSEDNCNSEPGYSTSQGDIVKFSNAVSVKPMLWSLVLGIGFYLIVQAVSC